MDETQRLRWLDELLDEVLIAIASEPKLAGAMILRGGRILRRILGSRCRLSTDLDATLKGSAGASEAERNERGAVIRDTLADALRRRFDARGDGRFTLDELTFRLRPKAAHPFGWDMLVFEARVEDAESRGVLGLPSLTLEIAAAEDLAVGSVESHTVGAGVVTIYTLERQAAEKLRAFLQSSSPHRALIGSGSRALRIRDLYDLGEVIRVRPPADRGFWDRVAEEFVRACRSRYVSCEGEATFEAERATAESTWLRDPGLSQRRPFDDVWEDLRAIVRELTSRDAATVRCDVPRPTQG